MLPLYFGAAERRLFGVYQPGLAPVSRPSAVLMCAPFGQEAIRSHRLLRVLGDRLVRSGISVLRFDAYGMGDADGDDLDVDLDGWRGDVLRAHQELADRSAAEHICWMGIRLGATAALAAAHDVGAGVQRLVLWDPIVDGASYLQLLRAKHRAALTQSFSFPDPAWRDDPAAFADEALGFALSPLLREQLGALRDDALTIRPGTEAHVVVDPGDAPLASWLRRQCEARDDVRIVPLEFSFDWTAEDALNTALVPAQALHLLGRSLDESSP